MQKWSIFSIKKQFLLKRAFYKNWRAEIMPMVSGRLVAKSFKICEIGYSKCYIERKRYSMCSFLGAETIWLEQ